MSAAVDSRERVLERIRAASHGTRSSAAIAVEGCQAIPRHYVRRGMMSTAERLERLAERLREYDAEVVACAPGEIAATIAAQLNASGRRRFVVPEGLPAEWLADGFEWKVDHDLPASEIEQYEGVVTACFCGVAESGTIVLHHSASEGRRVISLLPDWHLCVLRASQIVETLPEYFDKCREQATPASKHRSAGTPAGNEGTREQEGGELGNEKAGIEGPGTSDVEIAEQKLPALVTWISGPSATADIEMTRIKGVHGPRFLHVVMVRDRD